MIITRRGFVSPARAATMLGRHRKTIYNWARAAADGGPSKFDDVQRHPITGYLSIPVVEVEQVKDLDGEE